MPARSAFVGMRKKFLSAQLKNFAAAVANGTKEDYGKDVIRRYFKRFPPELPHDQEPSKEHLASVNDALPDIEPIQPDPADYPEDQRTYYALEEAWTKRQEVVKFRSAQIIRWLVNNQPKETSSTNSNDPYDFMSVMKRRLLNKVERKPRKGIAHQIWGKLEANKPAVDAAYAQVNPRKGHLDINVWNQQAKELFLLEPEDVQQRYERIAKQQHQSEVEAWNAILKMAGPTDPKGRQICIDGISSFLQPIFDLVVEFTGMRLTFMMGGPEPADHGRLNIISIHAGHTKGAVKMTFGEAESDSYQRQIVPVFSDFLRKCYTREDCVAASLGAGTASLLPALSSKHVTYGSATGENYGPPPDETPATAQNTTSSTASSQPLDGVRDEVVADGRESATDKESDIEDPSRHRSSSANAKQQDLSSTPSSQQTPQAQKGNAAHSSEHNSSGEADDCDEGDGMRREPLKTDHQLRHSSPTSDFLVPSPTNSCPPSPTSPLHGRLHGERLEVQVERASSTAGSEGFVASPANPPVRCGPPGRRTGAVKTWRIKACRRAPPRKPVSSDTRPSEPISRPPTAAARVLVPLYTVFPPAPSAEATSNVNSHLPSGAPTAQDTALSTISAPNIQPSPAEALQPGATLSPCRMRTRRYTEGAVVAAAGQESAEKEERAHSDKENIALEKAKSGAGKEEALGRGAKRRSTVALEELPAKRMKVTYISSATAPSSPSTTSPSTFSHWALPHDAPHAIKQTLQLVRLGGWGKNWEALVSAWLEFEKTRGYPTDQRLGCKHRPPAVSEWIQRARAPTFRPTYKTNEYRMMFWKWWAFLQPEWREIEADSTSMEVDGGWDALDKAGTNGFISVMAALFFWGFAVEEEGVGRSSWDLAVADVCWVLRQLK